MRSKSSVSAVTWAVLLGGALAVVWALRNREEEAPGKEAGASDTDPPFVVGDAPLAPNGASVLLLGDDIAFDLKVPMASAASQYAWDVRLATEKGATVTSILNLAKLLPPDLMNDVVVVSIGTFDVAKYERQPPGSIATNEGTDLLALATWARSRARRGVVWIVPPSFHRFLLVPSVAEFEMFTLLRTLFMPPYGPKVGMYGIYPSWRPEPVELRADGTLTDAGALVVAALLAYQLRVDVQGHVVSQYES